MTRPLVDLPFLLIGVLVGLALVAQGYLWFPRDRRWWLLRALMVALVAVVALRPSFDVRPEETVVAPLEVVVAVDRTASMSARDWNGERPRLDGVRRDIRALVDRLPTGRFTVLTFGRTVRTELPSTQDVNLIDATVDVLGRESLLSGTGSRIDRPLPTLGQTLERMREQHPTRPRLLVVMSDGENTDPRPQQSFAPLDPLVDAGLVLGYGSAEGALIPLFESDLDAGYLVDQAAGTWAVTRLDGTNLRTVAAQMGVPYVHRDRPGGLAEHTDAWQRRFTEQAEETTTTARDRLEAGWIAALALFALTLVELRRQWRRLFEARRALW